MSHTPLVKYVATDWMLGEMQVGIHERLKLTGAVPIEIYKAADIDPLLAELVQCGRRMAEMIVKNCDILDERIIKKYDVSVPFPINESDDYRLAQAFLAKYAEAR